ncbi:L-ascorbate oxidase-like [Rhodamnia argentea]|uniref:L-ascorbate oxidase-like n=1 Tax=Rhodamnia argentea TaxID=178133 RepID=A0ABM3GVU9_9MYRT|nr:L-ascorbate oxidase-like [Rhodamnia argentea]
MGSAQGTALLYKWEVQYEHTLPKAYPKLSITINGETPGPTISAHQGDVLIVEVTNGLGKENLAIEWDGVQQIAGALTGPIPPGKTFEFRFAVDQLGTYSYYAVSKLQSEAGLHGSIQVLPPDEEGKGAPFTGQRRPQITGSGQTKGL